MDLHISAGVCVCVCVCVKEPPMIKVKQTLTHTSSEN